MWTPNMQQRPTPQPTEVAHVKVCVARQTSKQHTLTHSIKTHNQMHHSFPLRLPRSAHTHTKRNTPLRLPRSAHTQDQRKIRCAHRASVSPDVLPASSPGNGRPPTAHAPGEFLSTAASISVDQQMRVPSCPCGLTCHCNGQSKHHAASSEWKGAASPVAPVLSS